MVATVQQADKAGSDEQGSLPAQDAPRQGRAQHSLQHHTPLPLPVLLCHQHALLWALLTSMEQLQRIHDMLTSTLVDHHPVLADYHSMDTPSLAGAMQQMSQLSLPRKDVPAKDGPMQANRRSPSAMWSLH